MERVLLRAIDSKQWDVLPGLIQNFPQCINEGLATPFERLLLSDAPEIYVRMMRSAGGRVPLFDVTRTSIILLCSSLSSNHAIVKFVVEDALSLPMPELVGLIVSMRPYVRQLFLRPLIKVMPEQYLELPHFDTISPHLREALTDLISFGIIRYSPAHKHANSAVQAIFDELMDCPIRILELQPESHYILVQWFHQPRTGRQISWQDLLSGMIQQTKFEWLCGSVLAMHDCHPDATLKQTLRMINVGLKRWWSGEGSLSCLDGNDKRALREAFYDAATRGFVLHQIRSQGPMPAEIWTYIFEFLLPVARVYHRSSFLERVDSDGS